MYIAIDDFSPQELYELLSTSDFLVENQVSVSKVDIPSNVRGYGNIVIELIGKVLLGELVKYLLEKLKSKKSKKCIVIRYQSNSGDFVKIEVDNDSNVSIPFDLTIDNVKKISIQIL